FFFSSRRRHTRFSRDWSSDVCSSDLADALLESGYDLILVAWLCGEIALLALFTQSHQLAGRIKTCTGFFQGWLTDVRACYSVILLQAQDFHAFVDQHGHGVGLFSRRAAHAPS